MVRTHINIMNILELYNIKVKRSRYGDSSPSSYQVKENTLFFAKDEVHVRLIDGGGGVQVKLKGAQDCMLTSISPECKPNRVERHNVVSVAKICF